MEETSMVTVHACRLTAAEKILEYNSHNWNRLIMPVLFATILLRLVNRESNKYKLMHLQITLLFNKPWNRVRRQLPLPKRIVQ